MNDRGFFSNNLWFTKKIVWVLRCWNKTLQIKFILINIENGRLWERFLPAQLYSRILFFILRPRWRTGSIFMPHLEVGWFELRERKLSLESGLLAIRAGVWTNGQIATAILTGSQFVPSPLSVLYVVVIIGCFLCFQVEFCGKKFDY